MISTKRLIDANILKTLFDVRYDTAFIQERTRDNKERWNGYCTGINWGRNTIANAPTVDAVEVVHGRCEKLEMDEWYDLSYKCLACGCYTMVRLPSEHDSLPYYYHNECVAPNYCPNCGAKMDGDGNG